MWKMSSAIWIADNVANVLGSAQTRYFVGGKCIAVRSLVCRK